MQKKDCIILAGGFGTRLKEIIPDKPKALAPVSGRAFIDVLLEKLAKSDVVSRAIIAVGYRADQIIAHLEKKPPPIPILYSFEVEPLGTGGALMKALEFVEGDEVFTVNGDSFTEVSLMSFLEEHLKKQAVASLVCKSVEDQSRYGCIEIDQRSNQILSFQEKKSEGRGWINAGIYLINRAKFAKVFSDYNITPCSLEKELFPELAKKGRLFAFFTNRPFIDIGTPQSFVAAQKFFD